MTHKIEKKRYNVHLGREDADLVRQFLKFHNSNLSEYISECFSLAAKNIRDNDLIDPKEKLKSSELKKILRLNEILLEKDDLDQEALDRVKLIAKKGDLSETKFMRNLIEVGSDVLNDCGKVGILQFMIILRNMEATLKDWAKKVRNKKVEPL